MNKNNINRSPPIAAKAMKARKRRFLFFPEWLEHDESVERPVGRTALDNARLGLLTPQINAVFCDAMLLFDICGSLACCAFRVQEVVIGESLADTR